MAKMVNRAYNTDLLFERMEWKVQDFETKHGIKEPVCCDQTAKWTKSDRKGKYYICLICNKQIFQKYPWKIITEYGKLKKGKTDVKVIKR